MKKALTAFLGAVILLLAMGGATAANAQEFEANLNFVSPLTLMPDQVFEFTFRVRNTTTPGATNHWIYSVELFMPSTEYEVFPMEVQNPDSLHGGIWEFDAERNAQDTWGIVWTYTEGGTSAGVGDIHEGEQMDFNFKAQTDSTATDGFHWRMIDGIGDFDSGTAYVGGDDDFDDDDADDDAGDDDNPFGDDDADPDGFVPASDEDEGSACGC